MEPILLYSGGVDSLVTLKFLLEKGFKPYIYHFWTQKLKPWHQALIKRNLRRLYPTDAYYVFPTETLNLEASMDDLGGFHIRINEEEKMHINEHGHTIASGHFKANHPSAKAIIEDIELYQLNYFLPLKDMDFPEIDEIWETLPKKVQRDTLSSTRMWARQEGFRFIAGVTTIAGIPT